jgi:hypothetical protein
VSAKLGRNYRAAVGSGQRLFLDGEEIRLFDPETATALAREG